MALKIIKASEKDIASERILRLTGNGEECKDALLLAKEAGVKSIAFVLGSAGMYDDSNAETLKNAMSAFVRFLSENEMEIILAVPDIRAFELSGEIFNGLDEYIDRSFVSVRAINTTYNASIGGGKADRTIFLAANAEEKEHLDAVLACKSKT